MSFVIPSQRKRKATDTNLLNPSASNNKEKRPRLSDGRTNRRTPQNHVSVTVRFDPLNQIRAKRKDQALPNCWIDNGPQNAKVIEKVYRGDIAFVLADSVPFSHETGLTSAPTVFVNLNNFPKNVDFRVFGTVENPSFSRGADGGKDCFGNVQARGVNTLTNQGHYTIVAGDLIYALPLPETTEIYGTTWSMNAIKGTGDGTGTHPDYNQKLVAQMIPLKHRDVNLTIDMMKFELDDRIGQCWAVQNDNASVFSSWPDVFQEVRGMLKPEKVCLIPGMEKLLIQYFLVKSFERALVDLYSGVDMIKTVELAKLLYVESHRELKEYWAEVERGFSAIANPEDMRKLSRGTGDWTIPAAIQHIRADARKVVNPKALDNFTGPIAANNNNVSIVDAANQARRSELTIVLQTMRLLTYTMNWIQANDVTHFMESMYVGKCISAQAQPGYNFDMLR